MKLVGLAGIAAKERAALLIYQASDIACILKNGFAATTAGPSGAINVWMDDEGLIRCEKQVSWLRTDNKIYKTFYPAIRWTEKQLKNINS